MIKKGNDQLPPIQELPEGEGQDGSLGDVHMIDTTTAASSNRGR